MTTDELYNIIAEKIIERISNSKGLGKFLLKKAKFEGWLKVEIVDILVNSNFNAIPEIEHIDIYIKSEDGEKDIAIELKTLNTNYTFSGVNNATRPITKNISSVVNDCRKLKNINNKNKFVIFIVFPVKSSHHKWEYHLRKVKDELQEIKSKDFQFSNNFPGTLYIGRIGE